MPDKQLPIPGLEVSPWSTRASSLPPQETDCAAGWITSLEKRVISLEMEMSILKIQMELDRA